jgi:hypothetical protein
VKGKRSDNRELCPAKKPPRNGGGGRRSHKISIARYYDRMVTARHDLAATPSATINESIGEGWPGNVGRRVSRPLGKRARWEVGIPRVPITTQALGQRRASVRVARSGLLLARGFQAVARGEVVNGCALVVIGLSPIAIGCAQGGFHHGLWLLFHAPII